MPMNGPTDSATGELAVETEGLRKVYGDVAAVDGLDLRVRRGALFGFLGPNGAGKSTTIRVLTGLVEKSAGRAAVLGVDLDRDPVEIKRRIGVVPEELVLFNRLTGEEYLTFVGRMYGLDRSLIRSRSSELLDLMELPRERKKLIVDYSHGMQKKLAFSAAVMHEPQLLFLDEPFEGIDAIAARMIKQLMRTLLGRGVTIFLTSHILEIVEKLCDDIAIIHEGRLVAQGSLAELQRGVAVASDRVAASRATLEEIFLSLVEREDSARPTLSWLE
jgi:ABC-2 type transport system ATP-binding protein